MAQKDSRQVIAEETRLLKELSEMKFSFKKLLKAIELDAVITYYNK